MLKTIVATIARYVMFRPTDMCTVFQECVVLEECPGYHPSYRRGLYSAEILKTVVATNSKYALFLVSTLACPRTIHSHVKVFDTLF